MSRHRGWIIAALFTALSMAGAPVAAQPQQDPEDSWISTSTTTLFEASVSWGETFGFLFSTTQGNEADPATNESWAAVAGTTLSTTTLVVLGGLTAVGLTTLVASDLGKGREKALRRYLRQNHAAVLAALSAGHGRSLDDLSFFFAVGLDHRGAFGRALRRERAALLEALAADVDAARFAAATQQGMLQEPALLLDMWQRGRLCARWRFGGLPLPFVSAMCSG